MFWFKIILAGLFGLCWGFSISRFIQQGNWEMATLTAGLFCATFYLACWIADSAR